MQEYALSIKAAQVYIFVFLALGAVGTSLEAPWPTDSARKHYRFFHGSHCSAGPAAAPCRAKAGLSDSGGYRSMILSSLSVIVVYAQELLPGINRYCFGLIIGPVLRLGAIGSVALGEVAG
jgi:FSR family fosmidomycin resistance protein-like MFS transporter